METMSAPTTSYLPFRGLSAWFSCSVAPSVIQQWDYYGGTLAGEEVADYLFSDDSLTRDTVRVYETQHSIAVVQPSWLLEILQRQCLVYDVPLGQHLLQPHHLVAPRQSIAQTKSLSKQPLTSVEARERNHTSTTSCNQLGGGGFAIANTNAQRIGDSATWESLEEMVDNGHLDEIDHLEEVKVTYSSSGRSMKTLYDFVCTKPGFRVQRIG